jgi:lysyl-tRNA synthetase class 2
MSWQPSAAVTALHQRATALGNLRQFFSRHGILEVETPLLGSRGITDPAIEPLAVERGVSIEASRYLQTSPEYAMKRLLAAHGEPIFQIAKAFRDGEAGRRHNPEFTLLEWYRPGFDHHQLMDEVGELLQECLGKRDTVRYSYRELFLMHLQIDPFKAPDDILEECARGHIDIGKLSGDRDMWLDLLLSHLIEPQLAQKGACFVYDYPASQAALAQIVEIDGISVGQRFELYVDGMELANGYCELTDAGEQRERFEADNVRRSERGQKPRPIDENLLAAMEHGLPACSGVALGVDRLLMLMCDTTDIRDVLAFDWERA